MGVRLEDWPGLLEPQSCPLIIHAKFHGIVLDSLRRIISLSVSPVIAWFYLLNWEFRPCRFGIRCFKPSQFRVDPFLYAPMVGNSALLLLVFGQAPWQVQSHSRCKCAPQHRGYEERI